MNGVVVFAYSNNCDTTPNLQLPPPEESLQVGDMKSECPMFKSLHCRSTLSCVDQSEG